MLSHRPSGQGFQTVMIFHHFSKFLLYPAAKKGPQIRNQNRILIAPLSWTDVLTTNGKPGEIHGVWRVKPQQRWTKCSPILASWARTILVIASLNLGSSGERELDVKPCSSTSSCRACKAYNRGSFKLLRGLILPQWEDKWAYLRNAWCCHASFSELRWFPAQNIKGRTGAQLLNSLFLTRTR